MRAAVSARRPALSQIGLLQRALIKVPQAKLGSPVITVRAAIRMALPTTARRVWRCEDCTAKLESASRGRFQPLFPTSAVLVAVTHGSTLRYDHLIPSEHRSAVSRSIKMVLAPQLASTDSARARARVRARVCVCFKKKRTRCSLARPAADCGSGCADGGDGFTCGAAPRRCAPRERAIRARRPRCISAACAHPRGRTTPE